MGLNVPAGAKEETMFMNEKEKQSRSTVYYIAGTIMCLMVIGFFLLTGANSSGGKTAEIKEMKQLADQVQGMESTVKKKEGEVFELVDQYQKKTGTNAPFGLNLADLSGEERELLETYIGKETNVSARALLKEILNKKDEISELRERIIDIEDLLPAAHIAQKGESHYAIALAFLVDEKGVPTEQAQKILVRTALFDELAEGFKIWNFYTGNEYGTSVTQGDAKVSPNTFVYRAKKKLMDDRDKAVADRDILAENMIFLGGEKEAAVNQLDRVTKEKEDLVVTVTDLNSRVNSMFYRLGLQKNLKKKGIIDGGFLKSAKLKDVSPDHFDRSLDLAVVDNLTISAEDLGVKKIKEVVLYPRFHKKGKSYKVLITRNQKYALLTLMDRDKFKSERVVIAVK